MFVPRDILRKIERFMGRREIVVVQGPRRAGKTTLLKQIWKNTGEPKAFVNMDRLGERTAFEKSPLRFVERHLPEGRGTLFLDEIQRCKNAGEGLKLIYDELPDVKVYVSGSSSLTIRWDVATSLVGRLAKFDLLTFNFHEFLLARDRGLARVVEKAKESLRMAIQGEEEPEEPVYAEEIRELLGEYLVWGGYPEVVLGEEAVREKVLEGIVGVYLEKDVVGYFGVEHAEKYIRFTRLLAHSIGSPISLSSITSSAGVAYKTGERYLSILEQSYMVRAVSPFHGNLATELRKSKKVYFLDLGARNWILGNFLDIEKREDMGKLLENFAFRELIEWGDVWYWRTSSGAEVDFVVRTGGEVVPVEVKAGGRAGRGFYSFLRAYRPRVGLVLTTGEYGVSEEEGAVVYRVPVWYV